MEDRNEELEKMVMKLTEEKLVGIVNHEVQSEMSKQNCGSKTNKISVSKLIRKCTKVCKKLSPSKRTPPLLFSSMMC